MLALQCAVRLGASTAVRFAVLMHDLGKAKTPRDLWPSHHGHEEAGVVLIEALAARLRVPKEHTELAVLTARYHGLVHRALELKPATILVVEDDAIVQVELADWLAELGLTVLTANNADEAIVLLDSCPQIEILLTDIRMPGTMDGIRLAHHVRGRRPPVKIIVASGVTNTQLSELPDGSAFVPKPLEREKLWQSLADMMGANPSGSSGRKAALRA